MLFASSDQRFVLWLAAVWLAWIFFAWGLALLGIFQAAWLVAGLILLALGGWYEARQWQLRRPSASLLLLFGIALIWSGWLVSRAEPSVFTGRDQGSYAAAAFGLAETGSIAFQAPVITAFFDIYGPGKALNFPGFAYTHGGALVPAFPLGYITWLASFAVFFGAPGLLIVNAITLTLSLLFLFTLTHCFVRIRLSLGVVLVMACSFPLVWFTKFTLTENLALPLFLLVAWSVVALSREYNPTAWRMAWASGLFLAFTRIEGIVILAVALVLMAYSATGRTLWKKHASRLAFWIIPGLSSLILLAFQGWHNLAFYRTLAATLYKKWFETQAAASSLALFDWAHLGYGLNVFWQYGLLPIFGVGGVAALILAYKRAWHALIPLTLALPTLIYFIDPQISDDHPWLLRRYMWSVLPALLVTAVFCLARIEHFLHARYHGARWPSYYTLLFLLCFLLLEAPASWPYAAFAENRGLLQQTHILAEHFGPRDLVLVDREASGDPFALLSGPLLTLENRQAVYFFNPHDLDKLDASSFDHIYLVAPQTRLGYYESVWPGRLKLIDRYTLHTERLTPTSSLSPIHLPPIQTITLEGVMLEAKVR